MAILDQRIGKTQAVWSGIKSTEHIRLKPTLVERKVARTFEVEIRSVEPIVGGGIQALLRAWDSGGKPVGFGPDGSAEIQRSRIYNPPIMVPDPLGTYIVQSITRAGVVQDASSYREDVAEALLLELAHVAKVTGKSGASIVPGKTARTTSTFNPVAGVGTGPLDGYTGRQGVNEIFGTIRAGAGTAHGESNTEFAGTLLIATSTTDQYSFLRRGGYGFDSAPIPDTDTIDSATLSIHGSTFDGGSGNNLGGTPAYNITSFSPADTDDWANSDFANFGGTEFASEITLSSWTDTDFNDFALNASGLAHIDKAGLTHFMGRLNWDADNSFGGTWTSGGFTSFLQKFVDFAGTVDDPVLTVEHTAAGTNRLLTINPPGLDGGFGTGLLL